MIDLDLIDHEAYAARKPKPGVHLNELIDLCGFCNYALAVAARYPTDECRYWVAVYRRMKAWHVPR